MSLKMLKCSFCHKLKLVAASTDENKMLVKICTDCAQAAIEALSELVEEES